MNATLERIRNEVRTLTPDQRETLVAVLDFDLRGSEIEDDSDPEIEAAWDSEIKKRVDEIESGQANLLSYEQFMSVFDEARSEIRSRQHA